MNASLEQFLVPFIVIPLDYALNTDEIVNRYLNNGQLNTVNFINIFAQSIGYSISDEFANRAKNDGLYYYHVDGKTYSFDDIKK